MLSLYKSFQKGLNSKEYYILIMPYKNKIKQRTHMRHYQRALNELRRRHIKEFNKIFHGGGKHENHIKN